MVEEISTHLIVSGAGLLIGFAVGFIAWRAQFCVAGSVLAYVAAADGRGLRAIALASLTTLILAQGFDTAGLIDLDKTIYRTEALHWMGGLVGGFAFGYGMILASGCGAGSLVKLGGGDLRSLIVLIFLAIAGYMTLRGLTGLPRVIFEQTFDANLPSLGISSAGLDQFIVAVAGGEPRVWRWVLVAAFGLAVSIYCFRDGEFRGSSRHVLSGIGIGICVACGWLATGVLGADDFEPTALVSLTYVAPVANSLQYVMTFTGATVNFGIGTVVGVFIGSLVAALLKGQFRFQYVDGDRDLINAMVGGALMGIGGVFAFGCSFGNGFTGISTLSVGAFIGSGAILAGGIIAARRQLRVDA